MLRLQVTRLAAHISNRLDRRVVDVERQVRQCANRVQQPSLLVGRQKSYPDAVAVDTGFRGEQTESYLVSAHLKAEDANAIASLCRRASDVERKRALAQAGPRCHYYHVRPLHAVSKQLVDALEPGLHRRQPHRSRGERDVRLHVGVQDVTDVKERA